jgi:hypothetical protein
MLLAGPIASVVCLEKKRNCRWTKEWCKRRPQYTSCEPNDYKNLLRLDVPSVSELLKNVTPTVVSTGGADKSLARPGRKLLTGRLQPRRNWPAWASIVLRSPTLFSGSGPVGLPLVTWIEKTIEREVGRAKGLPAPLYKF